MSSPNFAYLTLFDTRKTVHCLVSRFWPEKRLFDPLNNTHWLILGNIFPFPDIFNTTNATCMFLDFHVRRDNGLWQFLTRKYLVCGEETWQKNYFSCRNNFQQLHDFFSFPSLIHRRTSWLLPNIRWKLIWVDRRVDLYTECAYRLLCPWILILFCSDLPK